MGQSSIDGELSSKPCLITGGMHDMEIDVDTMNPIPPMIDTPFLWSQICINPLPMNSERCLICIYIYIIYICTYLLEGKAYCTLYQPVAILPTKQDSSGLSLGDTPSLTPFKMPPELQFLEGRRETETWGCL